MLLWQFTDERELLQISTRKRNGQPIRYVENVHVGAIDQLRLVRTLTDIRNPGERFQNTGATSSTQQNRVEQAV